jgi:hypothetical protein
LERYQHDKSLLYEDTKLFSISALSTCWSSWALSNELHNVAMQNDPNIPARQNLFSHVKTHFNFSFNHTALTTFSTLIKEVKKIKTQS